MYTPEEERGKELLSSDEELCMDVEENEMESELEPFSETALGESARPKTI